MALEVLLKVVLAILELPILNNPCNFFGTQVYVQIQLVLLHKCHPGVCIHVPAYLTNTLDIVIYHTWNNYKYIFYMISGRKTYFISFRRVDLVSGEVSV